MNFLKSMTLLLPMALERQVNPMVHSRLAPYYPNFLPSVEIRKKTFTGPDELEKPKRLINA